MKIDPNLFTEANLIKFFGVILCILGAAFTLLLVLLAAHGSITLLSYILGFSEPSSDCACTVEWCTQQYYN